MQCKRASQIATLALNRVGGQCHVCEAVSYRLVECVCVRSIGTAFLIILNGTGLTPARAVQLLYKCNL